MGSTGAFGRCAQVSFEWILAWEEKKNKEMITVAICSRIIEIQTWRKGMVVCMCCAYIWRIRCLCKWFGTLGARAAFVPNGPRFARKCNILRANHWNSSPTLSCASVNLAPTFPFVFHTLHWPDSNNEKVSKAKWQLRLVLSECSLKSSEDSWSLIEASIVNEIKILQDRSDGSLPASGWETCKIWETCEGF